MLFNKNPFLDRLAEHLTTGQEFAELFEPKILEKMPDTAFEHSVHILRSPPGGGKTTILRSLTPTSLRAFYGLRGNKPLDETYQVLYKKGLMDDNGAKLLGVYLSCASGYADLPAGIPLRQDGLFKALFNCRVIICTLRSIDELIKDDSNRSLLDYVELKYSPLGNNLKCIPIDLPVKELAKWAEQRERDVYAAIDSFIDSDSVCYGNDLRFEAIIWLHSVIFLYKGEVIAPKRLLMIDDAHKLRKTQHELLVTELTEQRQQFPIWIAERDIALGEDILAQGVRKKRDLCEYSLNDLLGSTRSPNQFAFANFGASILDRRLSRQSAIPQGSFVGRLRAEFSHTDIIDCMEKGFERFQKLLDVHRNRDRYSQWLNEVECLLLKNDYESLRKLYITQILLERDLSRQQLSLDLGPLTKQDLEERDSSSVHSAADIFMHEELGIPYYFGFEKFAILASFNIEELLSLAAVLYDELLAKQILQKPDLVLSPKEQEKLFVNIAKERFDFIHRNHTEGRRAQKLIDSIGLYCREKTFTPNAPFAPGVTGIRLSEPELYKMFQNEGPLASQIAILRRVLTECVAENLLIMRDIGSSEGRWSGIAFYLNRTLCVKFGLPLQFGGWNDISISRLVEWMEIGLKPKIPGFLENV